MKSVQNSKPRGSALVSSREPCGTSVHRGQNQPWSASKTGQGIFVVRSLPTRFSCRRSPTARRHETESAGRFPGVAPSDRSWRSRPALLESAASESPHKNASYSRDRINREIRSSVHAVREHRAAKFQLSRRRSPSQRSKSAFAPRERSQTKCRGSKTPRRASWGASVVGRRFGGTTVSTTMADNAAHANHAAIRSSFLTTIVADH